MKLITVFAKINYIRMFNDSQSLLNVISKTILLIVILVYVHRLFLRIIQILTDHVPI
jgi:hypothetical protein